MNDKWKKLSKAKDYANANFYFNTLSLFTLTNANHKSLVNLQK